MRKGLIFLLLLLIISFGVIGVRQGSSTDYDVKIEQEAKTTLVENL
ncbi:hypothetical protein J2T56_000846 [Natronobacillus azotifigens]|uniref:Uncharacterized protein n=1 Tax=Natronobacillus azotifigens TaxID=472978 RepID=A0A9J6RB77_9BACI|nr:hypothetical protein [Natronobacillus azotifigens]MCZ0702489.1 hypothetical protein [Natronobacillus azotifigens]